MQDRDGGFVAGGFERLPLSEGDLNRRRLHGNYYNSQ
jgi:hypothetical protein